MKQADENHIKQTAETDQIRLFIRTLYDTQFLSLYSVECVR